ncbi:MAG: alpha-L-rhamnosidase C-terminal domain-containing protein [Chitinophagaceae bacterium]
MKFIGKPSFIIILLFCSFIASAQSDRPTHLRTSLLEQTGKVWQNGEAANTSLAIAVKQKDQYQFVVIPDKTPVFNWQVNGAVTAWRILLASSLASLKNGEGDYWDSKQIASHKTNTVYAGKPLKEGNIYYWQVQVWNKNGIASAFSEPTAFYFDNTDSIAHYPLEADWQMPVATNKNNGNYFADFGKDGFCQLRLHMSVTKKDTIQVEVGELANPDFSINKEYGRNIRYMQLKIPVEPGVSDYAINWPADEKRNSRNPVQIPDYIGEVYPFRYVSIKANDASFVVDKIDRRLVHYPFNDNAASFTCSDTIINKVWELCKYSMKATSFAGYYLDGDRERVPYEADGLINQLSHYASDAEYAIARRSMAYLYYHPTWPTEWSLQNVLLAWNDYQFTGDDSFLKKYYAELQVKVLLPLAGANGLISTKTGLQTDAFLEALHTKIFDGRRGLYDIVDWPQNGVVGNEKQYGGETDGFVFNAYNAVVNAFYYRNLVLMEKIATQLQRKQEALMYAAKAKQVFKSYQQVFVDAKTGLVKDGDSTGHASLHSNMMALDFGLVAAKNIPSVVEYIKSRKMACSVYGAQFLMESLFENDADDYAVQLLGATTERSWYNMIRVGSTITMEAWDKLYKPNLDLNHAWGAVPANIIIHKMMGIEPASPGFDTISIKPKPGTLSSASCQVPTVKGTISLKYNRQPNQESWEVTVPGGAVANIVLPITNNRKQVSADGKNVAIQQGAKWWTIKNVAPGVHRFVVK